VFYIYILVAENRLNSSTDVANLPSYTDKSDLNSTSKTSSSSSSSSSSHSNLILFRAAENGDTGIRWIVYFVNKKKANSSRTITQIS
jgi:hypothetical protein